ncbi:hypothetical protein K502DRAFT_341923 [Neoconidiobolus thromboides FSU 785]|nr:hypothetical protein K502DRAFT_341923 [Neoconidiobolus thromboides FSU 785]
MKLFQTLFSLYLIKASLGYIDLDIDKSAYYNSPDVEDYIKTHLVNGKQVYKDSDKSYLLFYILDKDANGFLDGHEIRANIHKSQKERHLKDEYSTVWDVEQLNEYVDMVLKEDDIDGDGRISIDEFMASQIYHHQVDKEDIEKDKILS